jgi:hypothetical protein
MNGETAESEEDAKKWHGSSLWRLRIEWKRAHLRKTEILGERYAS